MANIPVRVFPVTDSAATLGFNQLHTENQGHIHQKHWCPACEVEISKSHLAKEYEFEKEIYVALAEHDLVKTRPELARAIKLVRFTGAGRRKRSRT